MLDCSWRSAHDLCSVSRGRGKNGHRRRAANDKTRDQDEQHTEYAAEYGTHIRQDSLLDLCKFSLGDRIIEVAVVEIGNDLETFFVAVVVDEVSARGRCRQRAHVQIATSDLTLATRV